MEAARPAVVPGVVGVVAERQGVVVVGRGIEPFRGREGSVVVVVLPVRGGVLAVHVQRAFVAGAVGDGEMDPAARQIGNVQNHQCGPVGVAAAAVDELGGVGPLQQPDSPAAVVPATLLGGRQRGFAVGIGGIGKEPARKRKRVAVSHLRRVRGGKIGGAGRGVHAPVADGACRGDALIGVGAARNGIVSVPGCVGDGAVGLGHVPDAAVGSPDARGVLGVGGTAVVGVELAAGAEGGHLHPDDGLAGGVPALDLVGEGVAGLVREEQVAAAGDEKVIVVEAGDRLGETHRDGDVGDVGGVEPRAGGVHGERELLGIVGGDGVRAVERDGEHAEEGRGEEGTEEAGAHGRTPWV